MTRPNVVVSVEHGGNRVPARWREVLAGAERALESHRGWDEGALVVARRLARRLGAPLVACTTTRLLVDPNRSLGHRGLFSEWTRELSGAEREELVRQLWAPHREAVEDLVRERSRRGRVLHLSMHSFTPSWEGHERAVDVGYLYDPSRGGERAFADRSSAELRSRWPALRVRRNQPYRGTADGLTRTLRERFGDRRYAGVEIELSQRFPAGPPRAWLRLVRELTGALVAPLATASRSS